MSAAPSRWGKWRPWPRRIGGQIATLVALAALFTYIGNNLLLQNFSPRPSGANSMMNGTVLFAALPVITETVPAKRQAVVDLVNLMAPSLNLTFEAKAQIPETARPLRPGGADNVRQDQGDPPPDNRNGAGPDPAPDPFAGAQLYSLGVFTLGGEKFDNTLAVFPDGSGLYAYLPLPPDLPSASFPLQFMMGNWLVLLVIVLPLALIWAVLSVSRPLRRFAHAAEEFSLDGPYAPLPETGPEEVRVVAHALNSMRERVAVLAADRTRMLSAVGHDLRTPVTRMRLRVEFIADDDIRTGQLRDLARMETMIDNTLSFLRDGQVPIRRAQTDLVSLVQTLIDDFPGTGTEVTLSAPERLIVNIEPDAIRRVVENLVQNGLKFGTRVAITIDAQADAAEIRVEDDGPGIPEVERQNMLKPFVTGDAARSNTGFGLGLSIAEAIVRSHGGTLSLENSSLGGLLARITLPKR